MRNFLFTLIFLATVFYKTSTFAIEVEKNSVASVESELISKLKVTHSDLILHEARQNPEYQSQIDIATLEIFKNFENPFLFPLCLSSGSTLDLVKRKFAVSEEASKLIFLNCIQYLNKHPLTSLYKQRFAAYSESKFNLSKSYYFATSQKPFPIESWTEKGNKTYIFINSEISKIDLTRRIFHEIIIPFDAKFNFNTATFSHYLEQSGCRVKESDKSKFDDLTKLFDSHSLLQRLFSSIRIYRVEADFINFNYTASEISTLSDQNRILSQLNSNKNIEKLISFYEKYDLFMGLQSSQSVKETLNSYLKIRSDYTQLKCKSQFNSTEKEVEKNLFQWLVEPIIDLNSILDTNGPRPDSAGGWGPGFE